MALFVHCLNNPHSTAAIQQLKHNMYDKYVQMYSQDSQNSESNTIDSQDDQIGQIDQNEQCSQKSQASQMSQKFQKSQDAAAISTQYTMISSIMCNQYDLSVGTYIYSSPTGLF